MKKLLFRFFFKKSVVNLTKRSSGIKSIFDKTTQELREVNQVITDQISKKENLVKKLTEEKDVLAEVQTKNENLATKIEALLS